MITRKEFLKTIEKIYKKRAKGYLDKEDFFYEDIDGSIVLISGFLSEFSFQFDENDNLCGYMVKKGGLKI